MVRKRNYKAEYRRRLTRGKAKGLSKAQARGHPRPGEPAAIHINTAPASTPDLEAALKELRSGKALRHAAQAAGVSENRFRRFVKLRRLAIRNGRTWTVYDLRPRRVLTMTRGNERALTVRNFPEAQKAGLYWDAAGRFVRTNDIELLLPFLGDALVDTKGKRHPFETDPNTIHRLAAASEQAFYEIYVIQS
jgi:hypothetical protein